MAVCRPAVRTPLVLRGGIAGSPRTDFWNWKQKRSLKNQTFCKFDLWKGGEPLAQPTEMKAHLSGETTQSIIQLVNEPTETIIYSIHNSLLMSESHFHHTIPSLASLKMHALWLMSQLPLSPTSRCISSPSAFPTWRRFFLWPRRKRRLHICREQRETLPLLHVTVDGWPVNLNIFSLARRRTSREPLHDIYHKLREQWEARRARLSLITYSWLTPLVSTPGKKSFFFLTTGILIESGSVWL